MNSFEGNIIGIDLGTTYSLVALVEGTEPVIIPNLEGSNKTPSVVGFMEKGEVVIGEIARRQAVTNPGRTISSIKRLMGRCYSEIMETGEQFPFKITEKEDELFIDINGMGYKPEQISALILKKLKEAAEKYLNEPVKYAIITVPAYFDDLQRNATKQAANLSGLEVLRLVNEPTAAAMAYGLGKENEEIVAVYDFGGGTFDISILEIDHNAFEVLVSNGDTHLGGDDLDNTLVSFLTEDFRKKHKIDLSEDPVNLFRLKEVAEKAKCELSTTTQSIISLPFIAFDNKNPLHLEKTIHRDEFEEIIKEYTDRTIQYCRQALRDAGLAKEDITKVILVGGSSRIPLVRDSVESFFGMSAFKGVNPDEIVALGAATQAGIFSGNLKEVVLLDITPHSLGVEVKDGKVSTIIDKNSTIPIKAAKTFTTTENNQTFVNIHVVQGESENVNENQSLGKFTLSDIDEASAGVPRIRISFFINADGVLEISAHDLASGQEKKLTISHSFLTGEEKKRLKPKKRARFIKGKRRGREFKDQAEEILTGVALEEKKDHESKDKENFSRFSTFRIIKDGTQTEEKPQTRDAEKFKELSLLDSEINGDLDLYEESTIVVEKSYKSEYFDQKFDIFESLEIPIESEIKEQLKKNLEAGNQDDEAINLYEHFIELFEGLKKAKTKFPSSSYLLLSQVHTLLGNPEEARKAIKRYQENEDANPELALGAYEFILRYFPDYKTAFKEKGHLLKNLKQWKAALKSYEHLRKEDTDSGIIVDLKEIYTEILRTEKNPVIEFKLVKIYLKENLLDEAIEILQRLTQNEKYKIRALKILGLTYWQKKMYSQAWITFKILPPQPDLLDIFYRLAQDSEKIGKLYEAREIYQRILDESPEQKSAETKIRKLEYRINLQKQKAEQQKPLSALQDDRFKIIEEVNRGSMGVIYKAKDLMVDDIVAIKVLNDYLCEDPKAVERFKSEARAAKKLSHPHIVRIHDLFESGHRMFLSMEYIEGTDLKKIMSNSVDLTEKIIIKYLLQIADALSYAHSLRIIHRDIKPANIMITPEDKVKITDFGIAKILKADSVTKSGTAIIGTPLYMSPEQIIGGEVDVRSDIYSLGIMLYEMVQGDPPFYSGNIEYHHVHTEPPKIEGEVSNKLKDAVLKMIQKNPEDRFQNIREIFSAVKS